MIPPLEDDTGGFTIGDGWVEFRGRRFKIVDLDLTTWDMQLGNSIGFEGGEFLILFCYKCERNHDHGLYSVNSATWADWRDAVEHAYELVTDDGWTWPEERTDD